MHIAYERLQVDLKKSEANVLWLTKKLDDANTAQMRIFAKHNLVIKRTHRFSVPFLFDLVMSTEGPWPFKLGLAPMVSNLNKEVLSKNSLFLVETETASEKSRIGATRSFSVFFLMQLVASDLFCNTGSEFLD
ncbi:hypothetical protein Fot_19616 [Forsythia ovata]|uniref:Uncharacterized protein n=1 Tax=Forsythia ovata TaxID=205694 RepID=A0ABD1VLJ9_9LAMI